MKLIVTDSGRKLREWGFGIGDRGSEPWNQLPANGSQGAVDWVVPSGFRMSSGEKKLKRPSLPMEAMLMA